VAPLGAPTDRRPRSGGRGVSVYNKILVPLDGSKLAEEVLSHVQDLAQRYGSEVILIQVVPPLSKLVMETEAVSMGEARAGPEAATAVAKAEREKAHSYLESTAKRLRDEGVRVRAEILTGEAGDAVVAYAQSEVVDLIAMSTHGRSGLGRLVYGSVADHVLRHTGAPVLLIRSGKTGA
jgi:nucleotide-binding universal stress UspA family protein